MASPRVGLACALLGCSVLSTTPAGATPGPFTLSATPFPSPNILPGYVRLQWSEPTGGPPATHFSIYRGDVFVGRIANATTSANTFDDYAFPLPIDVLYRVEAEGGGGPPSVQTTPVAPLPTTRWLRVSREDWFHDAFPFNELVSPSSAAFETTTAMIKTGRNTAQLTGDPARTVVPGDSLVACKVDTATILRVDLSFRILPGPGNYRASSPRSRPPDGVPMGVLLRHPQNQSVVAAAGDGSFWGTYLAAPGEFGEGTHNGGLQWDPLTWNTARCDTAETNLFPVAGVVPLSAGCFASTYHEQDPKFVTLGQMKNRCFVIDPGQPAVHPNIRCDGVAPGWLSGPGTGWDGSVQTREHTKILPDGLLTPGSHVQYRLRIEHLGTGVELMPDPNRVVQWDRQASVDGQRWEHFGVHPDLWRKPAYGGLGSATMLVVDMDDGYGNERVIKHAWPDLASTDGNADGYRSRLLGGVPLDDPSRFVNRNAMGGFHTEFFNVRGGRQPATGLAGSIGSRLCNRAGVGLLADKWSRIGPTPQMLQTFYRLIQCTTGEMRTLPLGPSVDRSQNDVQILSDWLANGAALGLPNALWWSGSGSLEALAGGPPAQAQFLADDLATEVRHGDYRILANYFLGPGGTEAHTENGTLTNHSTLLWAMDVQLNHDADCLDVNAAASPPGTVFGLHDDPGGGPYPASILRSATPFNSTTLVEGFDQCRVLPLMFGTGWESSTRARRADGFDPGASSALATHYYQLMTTVFAGIAPDLPPEAWTGVHDRVPEAGQGLRLLGLANHPIRAGQPCVIRFELGAGADVVAEVFDVEGRRVRLWPRERRGPGPWEWRWDGSVDGGAMTGAGVYFVRVRDATHDLEFAQRIVLLR